MPPGTAQAPPVTAPAAAFGGHARPALIALAYFALSSLTMILTRFEGGLAFIWIANALLTAELLRLPRGQWQPTIAAAAIANLAATSLFGLGIVVAPLMAFCAVVEATLGTILLQRYFTGRFRLDTLNATMVFVAVAIAAPLVTAFPAAAGAVFSTGDSYWREWLLWLVGHSLGTITFAPIFLMILDGRLARMLASADRGQWLGIVMSSLACLGVIVLSFGQSRYPLLFLPMLPLVYLSFRYGQIGAAFAVLSIAIVGGAMTAAGQGPLPMIAATIGDRMQFFQLYLASAVLIALPVAAEISHRRRLYRTLQHSEARFRMLTQRSSDVIVSSDRNGIIDYVSPSTAELWGYAPETLIGTHAGALIHADDLRAVQIAYGRALDDPQQTGCFEYRGMHADGEYHWFESSVRGVVGDHGVANGVVSAVRDITQRKTLEYALASAAVTDPLTGLPNRRAFIALLEARVDAPACTGHDFCAIVDFDHFKQINDRYGHEAGDRALQAFASIAAGVIKDDEMAARIGGEEFAIILRRTGIAAARRACETLRARIAASALTARDGTPVVVTVSIGLAVIDSSTTAGIMAAADRALYRAKADGRDRVAVSADVDHWVEPVALAS